MYADGQGVQQNDLKAYHYFNQLVDDYDEDQPDRRNISAISNAFVAVGVYCLNGIPNSEVRPDPRRAHELFQYAATIFGDPNAQYNLAHMYSVGAGGLATDKIAAIRWLAVAAQKGHVPSQALLGHMLFMGDGVPHQRARGLMWLEFAKDGAPGLSDTWIRDLYQRDLELASHSDRQAAAALHDARAKKALPSAPVRDVVKFILKPLQFGPFAGAPQSPDFCRSKPRSASSGGFPEPRNLSLRAGAKLRPPCRSQASLCFPLSSTTSPGLSQKARRFKGAHAPRPRPAGA